ncbi:MAG: ABC transporter substrate-binding protein, partial [Candidatus Kariarchaeaceae archaeon]
ELNITTVATISSSFISSRANDDSFQVAFRSMGGIITSSQQFDDSAVDVKPQLQAIVDSNAKVIVLQALPGAAKTVFQQAADVGITPANGYQWVGDDAATQDQVFTGDNLIRDAMQGMIGISPNFGEGPVYDAFLDLWEACNGQTFAEYAGCGDRNPNRFAPHTYDSVYTIARAAHNLIETGQDPSDGDLLLAEMLNQSFDGTTGRVSFMANGDREGVYNLLNLAGTTFLDIGNFHKESGLGLTQSVTWSSGFTPGTVVVTQIETTLERITVVETEWETTTESWTTNIGETTTIIKTETIEIHTLEKTTETTGSSTVDFPFIAFFAVVSLMAFRGIRKR